MSGIKRISSIFTTANNFLCKFASMKTSKVKLDYMPSMNFQIFGISSVESDYKLAWSLNKPLGTDFFLLPEITTEKMHQTEEMSFDFGQNKPNMFSVFGNAINSSKKSEVLLISNRNNGCYLLDEFKNFDFLFIVRNDSSFDNSNTIQALRSDHLITSAYNIPLEKIKSKDRINLLWDSLQNRQ